MWRPPRAKRTATLFPSSTLFRSAELNKADDREDLRRLYAFGLALDVAAAVAAALTAALLAVAAGSLFGLKGDYIGLILIYCVALGLNIDRKSTRLNSSHQCEVRMPSFAGKKKNEMPNHLAH